MILFLLAACGPHDVTILIESKDSDTAASSTTDVRDEATETNSDEETGRDTEDEATTTQPICYGDFDGDGWGGDPTDKPCGNPGVVEVNGDCDDGDAITYPGAEEVCDDKDNDCDGTLDEDVSTRLYQDADADGFGDPRVSVEGCRTDGWVDNGLDCDDTDATINPAVPDTLDGIDNDCNGTVDR